MLKRMMLLTIVATTLLAPTVLAEHRHDRYRAADRVAVLSDELVEATRQMQRDAERRLRGRGYGSGELLVTLDRLDDRARRFRRDVFRGAHPRRLEIQLDRLVVAFERADRRMQFVRSGRLQRDFDRIDRVMRALLRNVDIAFAPRDRYDRRQRDGLHGTIVLGDRDDRFRARIRF